MGNTDLTAGYDLSIVIVSYNTKEMTRDCLASIENFPSKLSIQIIVVDNNSQDGTVEMVVLLFPHVVLIKNNENRGFAAANNQGFSCCNGEFILLLNSDTLVIGNVLDASLEYMNVHSEVGAMGCQVLNPDGSIQHTCSGYPTLPRLLIMTLALDRIPCLSFLDHYLMRNWQRDDEREVEVISGCYLMVRREILSTVGGLDERFFFFAEETDWCKRIREAGWKVVFAPVGVITHYGGGSVKKLHAQRDVMLTNAMVKLHYKHGGLVAAATTFILLLTFNISRALIWTLLSLFIKSKRSRAQHFRQVSLAFRSYWPKNN